jgi:CheY-like chemotaxis protein
MKTGKILLVEDDVPTRAALKKSLEKQGYDFDLAESGERAVEMIKINDYDLIITDLMMDNIDGLTVIKEAKRKDLLCEAILMSAYGTYETCIEAMKIGASDYFVKPLNVDQLFRKADLCLKRRSLIKNARKTINDENTFEITKESNASLMMTTLIQLVLKSTCDVLNADAGVLLLNEKKKLIVKAVTESYNNEFFGKNISLREKVIEKVFKEGRSLIKNDNVGINSLLINQVFLCLYLIGIIIPSEFL